MKTFLFVVALCLFPFQSLNAEDILLNGRPYRLETIRPIRMDAFGRVIPMPPMTILVPLRTARIKQHSVLPTTRNDSTRLAKNRISNSPTNSRLANRTAATPDVARPVFDQRPTERRESLVSSPGHRQHLASTTSRSQSTLLRDSRISQRRVY